MLFDQVIVAVYLVGILAVGLLAGRGVSTFQEYAVYRRSYGSFVIFATLSASFIGGGFSMGNAATVYAVGLGSVVALWGFSLKEILLAIYVTPHVDRFRDRISAGHVMAINYGKTGQVVTGILGLLVCAGITGAQVGAMGSVFETFAGVPRTTGIVVGVGIVIAYTTLGGVRAIVRTDVIQFVVLAIGLPLTLVLGIQAAGGVQELRAAIPLEHFSLLAPDTTFLGLISLFLAFMFGETLVPPYLQRLLLGRNAKATQRGTLFSGLFSIPFFAVTGLIGLVALAMAPDLTGNAPMPYVIQTVLPIGLKGFVIAGVISIVMSSADSFLNSASVALVNDVINPLSKRPLSDRNSLVVARIATLVVGLGSIVFALSIENVLDILLFSYNFWAPVVLVPLIAVLIGINASQRTFFVGAACGVISLAVWRWALSSPGGVDPIVIGVFCNLGGFWIAHQLKRPGRPGEGSEPDAGEDLERRREAVGSVYQG